MYRTVSRACARVRACFLDRCRYFAIYRYACRVRLLGGFSAVFFCVRWHKRLEVPRCAAESCSFKLLHWEGVGRREGAESLVRFSGRANRSERGSRAAEHKKRQNAALFRKKVVDNELLNRCLAQRVKGMSDTQHVAMECLI